MNGDGSGERSIRHSTLALVAVGLLLVVLAAASCAERVPAGSGDPSTPAPTTQPATMRPTTSPAESSSDGQKTPVASGTTSPTPDPYALADGVYPAYVRDVDVQGRTVTVDVVQTFEGWRAKQAALEDGLAPWKARRFKYAPVYIRNENPLLRTLSIGSDATIVFMGECEETTHGAAGLRELAQRALPYSTDWYYTLTMQGDAIQRIVQHIAISAC